MRRTGPGILVGLWITALGVIFLLDQQGIVPARESFHFFWPGILIFFGVTSILSARRPDGWFWGAVLILVGTVFLANELGYLHVRIGSLWPLILIAFGVWMLLNASGRIPHGPGPPHWHDWHDKQGWRDWHEKFRSRMDSIGGPAVSQPSSGGDDDAEFHQSVVLSGFKRRITSQHFKYAKVSAVLGGFNLDLTHADIDGASAVIHVESVFGGGEIRVPDTWKIRIDAAAVGGAVVDETYPRPVDPSAPVKLLIVRGSVVFGGVVIKN